MLKCFEAYSKIPVLYENGSTSGIASTLAYYLLLKHFVKGVLVSKRYGTIVAKTLEDLVSCQGSIYENFNYALPDKNELKFLAQICKPCDVNDLFRYNISLFCSSLYGNVQKPICKRTLLAKSSFSRAFLGFINKPLKCRFCHNHIGKNVDFSIGDSQYNRKINHVIVWSKKGVLVWDDAITSGFIGAKKISFEDLKKNQPYLFGKLSFPKTRNKIEQKG